MVALLKIEGIGEVYAQKLHGIGVRSVEALLKAGASPAGRKMLVEKSGVSDKLILEWVNRADLFRIQGVGEQYSDLLECSGVDSVPELAQRNADNLYQKMVEVNKTKNLVNKMPTQAQVAAWIAQAKNLPRVVQY